MIEKVGVVRAPPQAASSPAAGGGAASRTVLARPQALIAWLRGAVLRWFNPTPTADAYPSASYRFLARHIQADLPCAERGRVILLSSATSPELSNESLLMFSYFLCDELGCRTLLVDGTFRDSGVGSLLGHKNAPGFLDLVRGDAKNISTLIHPTHRADISILPTGRVAAGQSAPPIQAGRIAALLDEARASFDYIVVQQGAIFEDSRYLLLTREADLILLLVEESTTPMSEMERCANVFRNHQIANVRVVVAAPQ